MKILFFGSLAEKAGISELSVPPINTLAGLKEYIFNKYPDFKNRVYAIAVNESIITIDTALKENDEIAFMPSFSGG